MKKFKLYRACLAFAIFFVGCDGGGCTETYSAPANSTAMYTAADGTTRQVIVPESGTVSILCGSTDRGVVGVRSDELVK